MWLLSLLLFRWVLSRSPRVCHRRALLAPAALLPDRLTRLDSLTSPSWLFRMKTTALPDPVASRNRTARRRALEPLVEWCLVRTQRWLIPLVQHRVWISTWFRCPVRPTRPTGLTSLVRRVARTRTQLALLAAPVMVLAGQHHQHSPARHGRCPTGWCATAALWGPMRWAPRSSPMAPAAGRRNASTRWLRRPGHQDRRCRRCRRLRPRLPRLRSSTGAVWWPILPPRAVSRGIPARLDTRDSP